MTAEDVLRAIGIRDVDIQQTFDLLPEIGPNTLMSFGLMDLDEDVLRRNGFMVQGPTRYRTQCYRSGWHGWSGCWKTKSRLWHRSKSAICAPASLPSVAGRFRTPLGDAGHLWGFPNHFILSALTRSPHRKVSW